MERREIGRRLLIRNAVLTGAALAGGCSPVSVLNAVAPEYLFRSDLAYGPAPHQGIDLYRPAGKGPFPAVMFIYGGSWRYGNRSMYRFVGDVLAASGFLVMIPDYRLYPAVRYPGFLDDCAAAFAWCRRNAPLHGGTDAPPWLIGHSAGAYNAAMLTLDARWLQTTGLMRQDIRGTVGLAGPYDFLPITDPTVMQVFAGAHPLRTTQPIAYVDGHAPPMLLLAGAADTTVRPGNTVRLAERIRQAGGAVQDRLYPGVDHLEIIAAFSAPLRFLAPSLRDCLDFMRA